VISGRILTEEDIHRLEGGRITFQAKGILSPHEVTSSIYKSLVVADALPPATSTLVKQAVAHIQAHFDQHLTRQDIGAAVGVSKSYLNEIFAAELGLTPTDYLLRYRLSRARTLLCESALSITEVASATGFEDSAYFSRVFSKHMGCSPRAYRESPVHPQ
jgi:AraC-like DNA-binding protein